MIDSTIEARVAASSRRWLVTGAAGFIGSHLVEELLRLGQSVVGLDNFSTGHQHNLDDVIGRAGEAADRFRFVEGDIRDIETCQRACDGADYVLHEAALGSVPRSVADPATTNEVNVSGFLNMLMAARDNDVERFVYAASSSTYGDSKELPKREDHIGAPLSPYAVSKYVNELYASVFERAYGLQSIGLRYFNVFGPRQDPQGAYAAVIPRWVQAQIDGKPCVIFGDGETSRDFSFVANVVRANLLAATANLADDGPRVFNVGCGERTTLNQLFFMIRDELVPHQPALESLVPDYSDFREGDVRHSQADISRIQQVLGFEVARPVRPGIAETVEWFRVRNVPDKESGKVRKAG